MSFVDGFLKMAAPKIPKKLGPGFFSQAKDVGSAAFKGVKASGGQTVGSALKLEGLSHISDAAKKGGGYGKMLSTQGGRKNLAEAVGKAAPSIGALGAYGYGAKKVYDKATEPSYPQGY